MDRTIYPAALRVGDVITSDPRRDIRVDELDRQDDGYVVINPGRSDSVTARPGQQLTIRRT